MLVMVKYLTAKLLSGRVLFRVSNILKIRAPVNLSHSMILYVIVLQQLSRVYILSFLRIFSAILYNPLCQSMVSAEMKVHIGSKTVVNN